ncbi:CBS domain-containing protein [Nakamurella panacisegetis]|uniref:CBS domain-containing protein n=1 Tax=Nakamurella panacisegetis TaxID=1090615 RepID=A0A1H0SVP3_9ACTN|nr:CBS domain-containing protein [Nakamurella panacisegetis]SDP45298.1 CBS domain-containing protein [Nakamurella panacisegetis]
MQPSRPGRTAAQLSSDHPFWVHPADSLAVAARTLARAGFPLLPICDEHRRLVGTITAATLLATFGAGAAHEQAVSEVLDPDPPVIADYAGPEWVLTEMIDARTWVLPVIDAGDHLVTLISLHDLTPVIGAAVLADAWRRITARGP